jgi:hypothetical protein
MNSHWLQMFGGEEALDSHQLDPIIVSMARSARKRDV